MNFEALADSGKAMASQYGYSPRVKSDEPARPARTEPKALPAMSPKYVELCAVILREITRRGTVSQKTLPKQCTHHEFKTACGHLKDRIVYVGHAPAGGWRLR